MDHHLAGSWEPVALKRRLLLLALILMPSFYASSVMMGLLPQRGASLMELAMTGLFFLLFSWVSVGFWTALFGFFVVLRRHKAFCPSQDAGEGLEIQDPHARTAILLPVFSEDMDRVMAGVGAIYRSLERTGQLDRFDLFILSDTADPDHWVAEEAAWHRFCSDADAFGRVFYRRRRSNVKRKSGNVADFCRRWGRNYRYMIVLDADSVMAGTTMVQMVKIMENRPDIGILQTPPAGVRRQSLIARVQQFAGHLYGPAFAAGLQFWQMGDAQYWGHNVIIRVEPFMKHCQVPRLPGKGPLSGDILSHDFVEAALMRRSGYSVWLAYDLQGSFEETPPTLVDELKRDRRWCQGNLQHMRLIFSAGLFPTHRMLFVNGILSYGSALLWFLFLVLSTAQALAEVLVEPRYFTGARTLFPQWPVWDSGWALMLLGCTMALLWTPKVLSLALVFLRGDPACFGGARAMVASAVLETVLSSLLAPVRMIFHSLFVISTLLGHSVGWTTQTRDDRGTTWGDALKVHWWSTLLGLAWGALVWLVNPRFFWWLSPVVGPLVLSIPLSVLTSPAGLGLKARQLKLFLTPMELEPCQELQDLEWELHRPQPYSLFPFPPKAGFLRAVVDPAVFSLHSSLILRHRTPSPTAEEIRREIADKALALGPQALDKKEKTTLLRDPLQLRYLHQRVWELEDDAQAAQWGLVSLPPQDQDRC